MRTIRFLSLLLLLAAPFAARPAFADRRNPLDGQPAIRHKVELRKMRFEITPSFITSTNQDYRHAIGFGGLLRFHLFDWLAIGIHGAYFPWNPNTPLENEVRNTGLQAEPYQYPGPQPTLAIHDQHILNTTAVASAFLTITPWSGKFALFSAAFASYDFFLDIGGGIVYYTQNGCCSVPADQVAKMQTSVAMGGLPDPNLQDGSRFAGVKGAGMIGVGVHIFFTDWVGLTLELRDYFAKSNPGGLDTNGDRVLNSNDESIQNHIFFGLGVTFMLPPTAKISH